MGADLVFVNGPVFTSTGWMARGVSVSEGRIAVVGGDHEVRSEIGPGTEVVDLAGRMLLPGFQDAHVHPLSGGLRLNRCELSGAAGPAEALRLILEYASTSSESWIRGGGWAFPWFDRGCPAKELLDSPVPDRPAYLVVGDGHSAWANSAALTMAGIDSSTPDPVDGRIERNSDGSPQGTLHEGAMKLIEAFMPPTSPHEWDRGFDAGQDRLLSHGITSWQDAMVTEDVHHTYLRAAGDGRLVGTVRGAIWWERDRGLDQIDEIEARSKESTDQYRPRSVKLMLDGVIENFTAAMLHCYHDASGALTDDRGIDFIDPDRLKEAVIRLDRLGFQCHFHALGDAAVRNALDAVEAARFANGFSDLRHHLAHLQVVDPADLRRFRRLGVIANCQALWACREPAMTDLTLPFIGDRGGLQYPFGALEREGVMLAMGSDWPVTTDNVMHQIAVAVTRLPVGDRVAEVFLPEQRLSLATALTAFTAGSAYVNHLDRGRIAPGLVADLAVLSANPFEVDVLSSVDVDQTFVGGRKVFERLSLSEHPSRMTAFRAEDR